MRRGDVDDYRDFVAARLDRLRRLAFLLSRDWDDADDVVAIALGKLYRNWSRAIAADDIDAYVRAIVTRTWLDELRRPWRREVVSDEVPELAEPGPTPDRTADRDALARLLDGLPPKQRAVVVLRFYSDMSIEQTAAVL